jgi:hypothetical protein
MAEGGSGTTVVKEGEAVTNDTSSTEQEQIGSLAVSVWDRRLIIASILAAGIVGVAGS